jgi:hypothetical protein
VKLPVVAGGLSFEIVPFLDEGRLFARNRRLCFGEYLREERLVRS